MSLKIRSKSPQRHIINSNGYSSSEDDKNNSMPKSPNRDSDHRTTPPISPKSDMEIDSPTSKSNQVITSYGVSCIRKNKYTNNYEILLIKKRVTYAFLEFLRGRYDPTKPQDLKYKFNNMTICEKILIKSKDFNTLWMYSWGRAPSTTSERSMYQKSSTKYEMICKIDNGNLLIDLLNATNNSNLLWECPKGRMNKREQPIETAIREFEEETGLSSNDYTLVLDEGTVEYEFSDGGLRYRYVYYLAMMNHDDDVKYDFSNTHMITEVSEIKFMSQQSIQSIGDEKIHKVMKHVVKKMKRYFNMK